MVKKASPTGQAGSVGQDAVKLEFSKMGWGPIPVLEHDDGTDFYVQVRDTDLTALGLLVGVQVKNEKQYFQPAAKAKALEQNPPGWWYRTRNQDEAGYWLSHAVPHILALYDRETGASYWGHITPDKVKYTDNGALIWIPADNKLEVGGRDALLGIASTAKAAPLWAGSSWDNLSSVHPSQRLRMAMVTPRIAAPHRNRKVEAVSPEEAIATLMMCRLDDVASFEAEGLVPDAETRLDMGGEWELFDALKHFLTHGDLSSFENMRTADQPPRLRAAATALWLAFLIERGQAAEAEQLASAIELVAFDDPVDQAWLRAHHARALLEVGRVDCALPLALKASAVGVLFPGDPTALAIRAAALALVLDCDWTHDQGAQMVRSNDTAPAWWRGEQRGWALSAVLHDRFNNWANPDEDPQGKEQGARRRLRSLTLATGAAADHRAWIAATTHLASFSATLKERALSSQDFAEILKDLRVAGALPELKRALHKLKDSGPLEAIAAAAVDIDLMKSSRTSFRCDVQLIHGSADLLDAAAAARHASAALRLLHDGCLDDEHHVYQRSVRELVGMLEALWPELEADTRRSVMAYMTGMAPVTHQLDAEGWASLVSEVRTDEWLPDQLLEIRCRIEQPAEDHDRDHAALLRAWAWVLAQHGDNACYEALQLAASDGSVDALTAIRRLTDLTPDAAAGSIGHLRTAIHGRIDAERNQGSIRLGGPDPAVTLIRLNGVFPELADWEPIRTLLAGPAAPEHLSKLLDEIAEYPEVVPESERSAWVPLLERLLTHPQPRRMSIFGSSDLSPAVRRALFAFVDPLEDELVLAERLASGDDGLVSVARAIGPRGNPGHGTVLACLSVDESHRVRGEAAAACVRWILRGGAPTSCQAILERLLASPGRGIVAEVMRAIPHQPDLTAVHWLLEGLTTHPSASVRRRVVGLLTEPEVCRCRG